MFDKDTLHHAYFIEGDKDTVLKELYSFLYNAFGVIPEGHPDVHFASHDSFGIDESRALQDMQSMMPLKGDRKFFILWVGAITSEAQNSLLKVFEEPTAGTHFFIVSSSQRILLPTLRSRMNVVVHISSGSGSDTRSARDFISMSPKDRLDYIAPLIEAKDKSAAERFLQSVVAELHRSGNIRPTKELLSLLRYLKDRSPSIKLLLERVALLDL